MTRIGRTLIKFFAIPFYLILVIIYTQHLVHAVKEPLNNKKKTEEMQTKNNIKQTLMENNTSNNQGKLHCQEINITIREQIIETTKVKQSATENECHIKHTHITRPLCGAFLFQSL